MTSPVPTPPTPGDPAPTAPPVPPTPTSAPPSPASPADPTPIADGDRQLGPAGERALAAERETRRALEKQLAELAPLRRLVDALATTGDGTPAGGDPVAVLRERLDRHEETLAAERLARWRAEVAHEKGLSPAQAARLVGNSREELAADADALVALFPAPPVGSRVPVPDPSQGSRGAPVADLAAAIAEAEARGDVRTAIALKLRQHAQSTNRT